LTANTVPSLYTLMHVYANNTTKQNFLLNANNTGRLIQVFARGLPRYIACRYVMT